MTLSSGQFFKAVKQQRDGAVLALLKHNISGRHLLVCSTHLYWNPKWPDVKLAQMHALCGAISKFLKRQCEPLETPVMICGDLNSIWRKHKVDVYDKVRTPLDVTLKVNAHPFSFLWVLQRERQCLIVKTIGIQLLNTL